MTTQESLTIIRQHAEDQFAHELTILQDMDSHEKFPKPSNWQLSPAAVRMYILGGVYKGKTISAKYIGDKRLIEVAIATLATDRALLLSGLPGTAKSWVSEHLAASISGDSTLLIQGTAGTDEPVLRYGWNYAQLLTAGPSMAALVQSPIMLAMERGSIARVEELTRMQADVQDALITILSEKTLPIPELSTEIQARRGFNVIATANSRDKGVQLPSSALQRRFNTVVLPTPSSLEEEVQIVRSRVADTATMLELPASAPTLNEIKRIVTVFRELREGKLADGSGKVKSVSGTLSPAEAISAITGSMTTAAFFGSGSASPEDYALGLAGVLLREPATDKTIALEYFTTVQNRTGWKEFVTACKEVVTSW